MTPLQNRVLCHVGPWSLEHYQFIAKELAPEAKIALVSGHPKCDGVGFFARYYQLVSNKGALATLPSAEREADIILRCRLLRDLEDGVALMHLRAAWQAMGEMLDQQRPDLVLSETIDSYVMDVLYFQAKSRGIPFVGLVPTFISGYFRVSARGEFVESRVAPEDEVQAVLNKLLQKSYRPDFVKSSDSSLVLHALGRWLRNMVKIPYFALKRLKPSERFNYHNWATLKVSLNWLHAVPALNLGDADWQERATKAGKPVIYIPLQMIPEATVDYWCEDIEAVSYETYLLQLVRHLGDDFTILIKEHPNVLGYRNPQLYRKLSRESSVLIAPTTSNSNLLIDTADMVLVWTGSVGFEAAIRGKPVLTTCRPYYQIGPMFMPIDLTTTTTEILRFKRIVADVDIDSIRKELVTHVLSGTLPGRYIIDGSWKVTNTEHINFAKNIATQLRRHLVFNDIKAI
jgi:hypothetical protein